jgi:uncharacterized protein YsxB (DUF464 family)
MDKKTYYQVVTVVFAVIAVGHALRVYYGWEAVIAGVAVPAWVSIVAVFVAGYLAVRGWQFARKHSK